MAKSKLGKLQTIDARTKGESRPNSGVATLGSNVMQGSLGGKGKGATASNPKSIKTPPDYELSSRSSPWASMILDPVNARPALPPISLNSRSVAVRTYQEVLLTSDSNGACACYFQPLMAAQYCKALTISGSQVTALANTGNYSSNVEYTSFSSNFRNYCPTVMEIVVKYTGSNAAVAGRMYGIVGSASAIAGNTDLATFPLDVNGCEQLSGDGISCTWYSTSAVWNNPCLSTNTTLPTEWGDCVCVVGMIGGPASLSNIVSVGVYLHLSCTPYAGICGINPTPSLPDPTAEMLSGLMMASTEGLGVASTSLAVRDRHRKRKALIRDVIKRGGNILGLVSPYLGTAASPAAAIGAILANA